MIRPLSLRAFSRLLGLAALCAALSATMALSAAPARAAGELTNRLQQRYDATTTLKADFTQVLLHRESGAKETRQGTLQFRKPLLVRWETKAPHAELLVVTANEIWNYLPDEEVAYKYPVELVQDSRSIIKVITGQARLEQDFDVAEEADDSGMARLHMYPKEPTPQLTEAFLWVDSDTNLIRRAKIIDFYGNENDITLNNLSTDAGVQDSAFRFAPPKGVDVEDRTKQGSPEKQLFN